MDRKRIEMPADFLVDNGILFEMNRQVLHPLGLQLEIEAGADGEMCSLTIIDNRAVPTPIYFGSEEFESGRERYEAYMAEHGRRNMQKRRQIGMVIQTGPNTGRHTPAEGEEG